MSKKAKTREKVLLVSDDPFQRNPSEHNYLKKLRELRAQGKVPTVMGKITHIHITHDDWCRIFDGMPCNCNPDITFEVEQ